MTLDLRLIGKAITELGRRLGNFPMPLFVALVIAIAAAKSTFAWDPHIFGVTEAFPEPISEKSNQFSGIALTLILGSNPWAYLAVTLLLMAVSIAYIWRVGDSSSLSSIESRTRLTLAVAWPLPMASLAWVGFGNELFVLFVALAVLSTRRVLWIVGIVGAPLSHPELSLMGFGGLWLLGFAPEFRRFQQRGLLGLLWSLIAVLLTSWWMNLYGAPSRLEILPEFVTGTVRGQLRHGVQGLYSAWGVWWILILIAILIVGRRARLLLLFTAVVGPTVVVLASADASKNFASASAAVGLAVFWLVSKELKSPPPGGAPVEFNSRSRGMLGLVFLAFALMPNVQFKTTNNPVPQPGDVWIGLLEVYVLPALQSF